MKNVTRVANHEPEPTHANRRFKPNRQYWKSDKS